MKVPHRKLFFDACCENAGQCDKLQKNGVAPGSTEGV
jgi:hypothetical protein